MPNDQLKERIAIVTGASSGIGAAIARTLVHAGAAAVINARGMERLQAVARELDPSGARVHAVAADASEENAVSKLLDAAVSKFGREADLVVVNAGRGLAGSILTSDTKQWEEMIRTNLIGAAHLMRAATKRMVDAVPPESWRSRPRDVVVIGSSVGRNISPFSSMYGSTKFALHSLAEALRREVAPKGVRITLIEPAVVRSDFQRVAGYDEKAFGEFMDKIGPVLDPADVARAVLWTVEQPAHVHLCDLVIRPTRQDYP